jgi:hypothetical protein
MYCNKTVKTLGQKNELPFLPMLKTERKALISFVGHTRNTVLFTAIVNSPSSRLDDLELVAVFNVLWNKDIINSGRVDTIISIHTLKYGSYFNPRLVYLVTPKKYAIVQIL